MSLPLMNRVVPVASFCSSERSALTTTSPICTASVRITASRRVEKSGTISTPSAT
jgi:hypothetical protein